METNKTGMGLVICLLILTLAIPELALAQQSGGQKTPGTFKKEELAQMLAPIALYPDPLLAQIFMASTYPIEVVQAARWVKENQNIKGDQLEAALKKKNWDVSVKSLAHFPEVLTKMSEEIEWATKLGDAFMAQQKDVMDMVQELRAKARAEGNLKTTKEQNDI